ncbi:MAG: molecular chaperone HtpG [Spirochaetaceae bacterium]|nr:MAG: molecular chaperone HtpG [Spirochaetaceae bacterium]
MAKHQFQTEVNQLLHLIVHSLYSHKEIFIRELVSNASDALDKLKYLTMTDDEYKSLNFEPRIDIEIDEAKHETIVVSDTGIGMDDTDLIEQLGTIAKSGTRGFIENLTGDAKKDSNLIGQFGVGFYSAFMVADRVEVLTRKAGEAKAWLWSSDGKGEFEIAEAEKESHGTRVTLFLNDEGKEYSSRWQIEDVIKKYSNHIAFPIFLHYEKKEYDDKGKEKASEPTVEQINSASALWRRAKNEITADEYNAFYQTISHETDDPLFYLHTKAEGTLEYTTLFYVPTKAPFDMYNVDYRPGVKLYVKRVFITDDEKELMPPYLRFLRGVIDSEDLPLNVSREILQQNRVLASIKSASVKKMLSEFARIALEDPELYTKFIEQYNRPLKEGLYSDFANRDTILDLVRFKSTKIDGFTSLEQYKARMLPDQKAIYYITGSDEAKLRRSPLLEAYTKKDIEVLIMDDDIDEIVVPSIGKFKDTDLKPVNRSDAGDDLKDDTESRKEKEKDIEPVLKKIKDVLGDRVKDVVLSIRLSDSPACIVFDDNDPSMKLQQMMRAMGQTDIPEASPILEVNADHPIVARLKDTDDDETVSDISWILLEQSLLVEGAQIKEPAEFVKRVNRMVAKAV